MTWWISSAARSGPCVLIKLYFRFLWKCHLHTCLQSTCAGVTGETTSQHARHTKMDNREMFYFSHGPVINGPANLPLPLKRLQRLDRSHLDLVWILHPCPGPGLTTDSDS